MAHVFDPALPLDQLSVLPQASLDLWQKAARKAAGEDDLGRLNSATCDGLVIAALSPPSSRRPPLATRPAGTGWRIVQRVECPAPDLARKFLADDLTGGVGSFDIISDLTSRDTMHEIVTGLVNWPEVERTALHLSIGRNHNDWNLLANVLKASVGSCRVLPEALTVHLGVDPAVLVTANRQSVTEYTNYVEKICRGLDWPFGGTLFSCRGQEWHSAGSSDAQELALALASALELARADEGALDRIEFRLVADAGQFTTMAKFRAFRMVWALFRQELGLPAQTAFVHGETSWRMMSARDPWVNMLRATVATFAAGLGGADAITVLPHSAILGLPDREARRLARNIQTILMDESHLAVVADPAAGAGAIESLTDQMAQKAWGLFQEIEAEGGLLASIAAGRITGRIRAMSEARAKDVARRRERITGVSMYPLLGEKLPAVLANGPAAVVNGLEEALPQHRSAEPWERLRDRSEAHEAATGQAPAVFLANLGPVSAFTVRATWAKNLVEAGGIVAANRPGFLEASALAAEFAASGLKLAILCSNDATYAASAHEAARALKAAGAVHVALAGKPGEDEAALRAAGVDRFLFDGLDMLAVLKDLHALFGTPSV